MDYWKQELFESDLPKNTTVQWLYTDDEPGFLKNKPVGYTKDSVNYHLNSHGFRGTELTEPAEFKILVSGCSHTFGVGINIEDTWGNQFAQKIPGAKVYNLALGGRSPDYVVRSVYKTINIIKPDLVLILWPQRSRFEFPGTYGNMHWVMAIDDDYPKIFASDYVQEYFFEKNQILLKSICDNAHVPHITFEESYDWGHIPNLTFARDLLHSGPEWNSRVAEVFFEKYQNLV